MDKNETMCNTPEDTFALGKRLGAELDGGDVVLLYGGLGAGKTLLTKGILDSVGYDVDEVTSPSFSLVNLYKTSRFDVYHVDLWRIDPAGDPAGAVGLEEMLESENAVTIVEWADRLAIATFPNRTFIVRLAGDGDEPRRIEVEIGVS